MRTAINASWIVGHENGRSHAHPRRRGRLSRATGSSTSARGFEGHVDRTIDAKGKLVAPGFIDTHVHSGHRASHRLITDTGRPMYYGQPFLEISGAEGGQEVVGDLRYLKHGDAGADAALPAQRALHGGRAAAQRRDDLRRVRQPALGAGRAAGTRSRGSAARAYLAPGYDCGRWVGDDKGRLKRVRNDAAGPGRSRVARSPGSSSTTARPAAASRASWCRARSRRRASSCSSAR